MFYPWFYFSSVSRIPFLSSSRAAATTHVQTRKTKNQLLWFHSTCTRRALGLSFVWPMSDVYMYRNPTCIGRYIGLLATFVCSSASPRALFLALLIVLELQQLELLPGDERVQSQAATPTLHLPPKLCQTRLLTHCRDLPGPELALFLL